MGEKMRTEDLATLEPVLGAAHERVVVSTFRETDLESANLLNVKIDRIRLKGERRMCAIPASDFLPALLSVGLSAEEAAEQAEQAKVKAKTVSAPKDVAQRLDTFPKE